MKILAHTAAGQRSARRSAYWLAQNSRPASHPPWKSTKSIRQEVDISWSLSGIPRNRTVNSRRRTNLDIVVLGPADRVDRLSARRSRSFFVSDGKPRPGRGIGHIPIPADRPSDDAHHAIYAIGWIVGLRTRKGSAAILVDVGPKAEVCSELLAVMDFLENRIRIQWMLEIEGPPGGIQATYGPTLADRTIH